MYDGTLGTVGPWEALVTFQQMLILADRHGVLDMTPEAIARRTTIPLEVIERGIRALETPDAHSRRREEDGRRIVRLDEHRDWGWQIVNHAHYRAIRSAEERREYQRNLMRERRAKAKNGQAASGTTLELPEWLEQQNWSAWVASRPALARTSAALAAALAKLERFRGAGHDPNAIIAESLANGWRGLFEPKAKDGKNAPTGRPSIQCASCGKRVFTWTGDKCEPCWRKAQGLESHA